MPLGEENKPNKQMKRKVFTIEDFQEAVKYFRAMPRDNSPTTIFVSTQEEYDFWKSRGLPVKFYESLASLKEKK